MKKSLFITAAFFTLLINANAQHFAGPAAIYGHDPLQVKYIGTEGDYLVFSVAVKSAENAVPVLSIDDTMEGELYSSKLNEGSKVRTMKIERRDFQVLDFKLVIGNTVYVATFANNSGIIKQTKVSEEALALR
ncbi:hypothetical protein BH11BAC4_BH11BAC4_22160 [soil metagenome]